mgnify:FL=1
MYTDEKIMELEKRIELLEKALNLTAAPNRNTALREMLSGETPLAVFDFSNPFKTFEDGWELIHAAILPESKTSLVLSALPVMRDEGAVCYDPILLNISVRLDLSRARYVHLRFTGYPDTPNRSYAQVYFKTSVEDTYTQNKCVRSDTYTAGEKLDIYLDMAENPQWKGILTGFRVDFMECGGKAELELIEIYNATPATDIGSIFVHIANEIDDLQDQVDNLQDQVDDLECQIDDISAED